LAADDGTPLLFSKKGTIKVRPGGILTGVVMGQGWEILMGMRIPCLPLVFAFT
jgi:hypothetical protein